jgi:hypothetical protein
MRLAINKTLDYFHSMAYQYVALFYRQCFCRDINHALYRCGLIRLSNVRWTLLPHSHANDTLTLPRHVNTRIQTVVLIAVPIEPAKLDTCTSIQSSPSAAPATRLGLNW